MTKFSIKNKIKKGLVDIPRSFFLFGLGPILRKLKKKPLPKNEQVLIHIGCGEFNDPRYINIDTRRGWHIDHVASIEDCSKLFPENYADLIYACHVLEHVSHLKIFQTIKGLYYCLKKDGILRLSVPNFDTIVEMYKEKRSIEDIISPLMGGQGYPGNFHYAIFNEDFLKKILLKNGFKIIRKWEPEKASCHKFDDWSRRKINLYNKNWEISLNIEAVK